MAISHIPRNVGHNFVPEYQISSVLYSTSATDRATSNLSFVLVQKQRKIDGINNEDSFREVGFSSSEAANGDVTLTITDDDTTPVIVFGDAGGGNPSPAKVSNLTANFVLVRKLSLPKISSWIQLENTTDQGDRIIYFSKKDVINHSNFIRLASEEKTVPLKLRLTDLYFRNSTLDAAAGDDQNKADGEHIKIIAGLTSIDSREFKDTVETFLGDNK